MLKSDGSVVEECYSPIPAFYFYDVKNDVGSLWNCFKSLSYVWQFESDVKSDTNVIIFQPNIEYLRIIEQYLEKYHVIYETWRLQTLNYCFNTI